jgi:hypothetical protein
MNISFALTTRQFLDRTKDVTRRLGWYRLKSGQILTAVKKGQGLKKGEHPARLGQIRVVSSRRERLDRMLTEVGYGHNEVHREGFPDMTPKQFVEMFCEHNGCTQDRVITRIEFEYL